MPKPPRPRKPRTLSAILRQRRALEPIKDVAAIDDGNDQVWEFWCVRLGAPAVRCLCEHVGKGKPARFADVHALLVASVERAP